MYAVKDISMSFPIWSFFRAENDQVSLTIFLAEMPERVNVVCIDAISARWCRPYTKSQLMEEAG